MRQNGISIYQKLISQMEFKHFYPMSLYFQQFFLFLKNNAGLLDPELSSKRTPTHKNIVTELMFCVKPYMVWFGLNALGKLSHCGM